mmetsp:Transcript_5881/g.18974  ORF Transcript_5881/g.18974 Transcript_5881/m.18974 type:complete len:289 (-) Transcript_5881:777-1643(-)
MLVAEAPASAAAAGAPRAAPALVGAQVREVVRVLAGEGLARRVGGLALLKGRQKGRPARRERRGDGEHRVDATEERTVQHHLSDAHVERHARKVGSERGEGVRRVERAGETERTARLLHGVGARRLQRAREEGAGRSKAEREDREDQPGEGRALHLGRGVLRHPRADRARVERPVLALPRPARAAAPLLARRERHPSLGERGVLARRVVAGELHAAAVEHDPNVRDGERRLCHVCGEHDLSHARRRGRKDALLLGGGQLRVQGQEQPAGGGGREGELAREGADLGDAG